MHQEFSPLFDCNMMRRSKQLLVHIVTAAEYIYECCFIEINETMNGLRAQQNNNIEMVTRAYLFPLQYSWHYTQNNW